MRVRTSRRGLLETLSDLLGIKAGIVLSSEQCIELLEKEFARIEETKAVFLEAPSRWWNGEMNDPVGLRAEEIEANFMLLLHGVGAASDLRIPSKLLVSHVMTEYRKRTGENMDPSEYARFSGEMARLQVAISKGETPDSIAPLITEYRKRHILDSSFPESREWDGIIHLNDLLKSEAIPPNTIKDQYFDQRYIDYLNAQEGKLDEIHWRQFEHLTGEYFRRQGYAVEITPPRGDGGIDVIAKKNSSALGPELIVAQCKRNSASNTVKIDTVKAFWTDMNEQNATRGLVVTTSQFEKGAREFCEAHEYRLTAADRGHVRNWLKALATKHS